MKGREEFGLFVRIVAFLLVLYGIYNLLFATMQATGVFGKDIYTVSQYIVGGLAFIGLGAVIGRLAERITDVAYPSDHRPRGE